MNFVENEKKKKSFRKKLFAVLLALVTVTTTLAAMKLSPLQELNDTKNEYEIVSESITDTTALLSSANSSQARTIDDAQVEAGETFGVMLKTDGTVWTWGNNTYGQLGNGTIANTNTYELNQVLGVEGVGHLENIKQISAGRWTVSALTDDGRVLSWGCNTYGQLGTTNTKNSATPVYMQKQVTITDGEGNTTTEYRDLDNIVQIARGGHHILALASDGTVWACGLNNYGQLGINVGNTTETHANFKRTYAVKVLDNAGTGELNNIKQISGGNEYSMALTNSGTVWCWGRGDYGQIGNGAATTVYLPQVSNLTDVIQIDAGGLQAVALKSDKTVWNWGMNRYGNLGISVSNETATNANYKKAAPQQVLIAAGTPLTGIKSISSMHETSYGLTESGQVYAWGRNELGQIGDGTVAHKKLATLVTDGKAPLTGIKKLAGGSQTSVNYLITNEGELYGSGVSSSYQMMMNRTANTYFGVPINQTYLEVSNNQDYVEKGTTKNLTVSYHQGVSVNDYLPTLGTLTFSSSNSDIVSVNQLGQIEAKEVGIATIIVTDTTNNYVGQTIINVVTPGAKAIPMALNGTTFTAMLKEDGTVWTSGATGAGELGNGSSITINVPTQVKISADEYLTDVRKIAVGNQFAIALKTDGTVWAWGINNVGQLGIGVFNATETHANYKRIYAVQVCKPDGTVGLDNIIDIDAGADNASALTRDGLVYAWGDAATHNGLAVNSTATQSKPVLVHGVYNAIQAESGVNNVIVLKGDGTVWGGGQNNVGQIGDGTITTPRAELVPVINKESTGLLTGVVRIATGAHHTVALKENKEAYIWGYNDLYQLGNNVTTNATSPIDLVGPNNTGVMQNIYDIAVLPKSTLIKVKANDGKYRIYVAGNNDAGQLSINSKANSKVFRTALDETLADMTDVVSIGNSKAQTASFVFEDGTVGISGLGTSGQHANGTLTDSTVITRIKGNLLVSDNLYEVNVGGTTNINVRIESGFNLNLNPVIPSVGTLEYTSLDESIATVSATGEIRGVSQGTTGIVVRDTTNNIETTAQVVVGQRDFSDIYKVVAGQNHTVMLKNDGTVWAWGDQTSGRLGNGQTSGKITDTPCQVLGVNGVGYLTDVIDVAAGADFTVALLRNGRVVTWGGNLYRTIRYNW